MIFARTKKGSGVAAVEDQPDQHGKPLADPEAAVEELGGVRTQLIEVQSPPEARPYEIAREPVERPAYEIGEKVATRGAYGDALAWLGSVDEKVVALDGEVGNSTYAERFAAKHPDRFFEMFIAEQQMVAAAVGLQTRGWKPFASSFGAFLSRAYDFIRMAAISGADLKLCGSHVGVSIGPDGPSQMALEDIAAFRAVLDSVVLYPSDPNQTVQLLDAMRERRGFSYMRTTREKTPVIYGPDESFEIGGSRVAALRRRGRRHPGRGRHHPARIPGRRRDAGGQGDRGPGHRPLLGQTGRRRDPAHGGRGDAGPGHRRGPLAGGGDRRDRRRRPRPRRVGDAARQPRRHRAPRQRPAGGASRRRRDRRRAHRRRGRVGACGRVSSASLGDS